MVRNYVPRKVSPARPLRVSVWVSDTEKARIEEAAAIAGVCVAQFVRAATLHAADGVITEEAEQIRGGVA